jgi:hypothetical protein
MSVLSKKQKSYTFQLELYLKIKKRKTQRHKRFDSTNRLSLESVYESKNLNLNLNYQAPRT